MKYKIVETDEVFDCYEDAVDACIDPDYYEDDDYFEEWVNNEYGSIDIGGVRYYAFEIIDRWDDGNYHDLRYEYCRSCNEEDKSEANYELRNAGIGDTVRCQGYEIEVIEDDFNADGETYSAAEDENTDYLTITRQYIEEQNLLEERKNAKEKEEEEDLMKLFQVIG